MHNRYPALLPLRCRTCMIGGAADRPLPALAGGPGAARCADDVWGGDPTTTFGFDGLSSAVRQALSMGLSGVSRWGSDIGGYDTIGADPRLTPELLKRWIEFGAVSGVMRIKKTGLEIPAYGRPQVWDPDVDRHWRKFTKLHTQLYPYIAAADAEYRRTGMPLMRALVLRHRATGAPPPRRTSSCSATTCSPRRCCARARARGRCTSLTGAGSTAAARCVTTAPATGPFTRAPHRRCAAGGSSARSRGSTSCRCSCAPAR